MGNINRSCAKWPRILRREAGDPSRRGSYPLYLFGSISHPASCRDNRSQGLTRTKKKKGTIAPDRTVLEPWSGDRHFPLLLCKLNGCRVEVDWACHSESLNSRKVQMSTLLVFFFFFLLSTLFVLPQVSETDTRYIVFPWEFPWKPLSERRTLEPRIEAAQKPIAY